jgi:subtilisin family serine protease/fibronectin type 3 domain-containing protein
MNIFYFNFTFPTKIKKTQNQKSVPSRRVLHFESLENREMLSVGPLLYLTPSPEPDYFQSDWFEQLEERSIPITTEGVIENEWIVQLKQESLKSLYSVTKAADYLDDYGVTVIGGLGSPGTLHVCVDADSADLQTELLAGISGLEYWERNYAYVTNGVADVVNDPSASYQWYLDTINVLPAWGYTKGEGVVVAVIDSGIWIDHPDLQANIWTNLDEIPNNGIDDDDNGFIDDVHGWNDNSSINTRSHGTHVTGIIGAVGDNGIGVIGIAPNVQILSINRTSNDYSTSDGGIAAINYVIKLKTECNENIKVINASFGAPSNRSKIYSTVLSVAGDAGIVFVAGAGNNASDNDVLPFYPASYNDLPNVISVASTDTNDSLSSFSNYGINSVDLAAPGDSIVSTATLDYVTMSGTSMAAPMVTATVALLASLHPDWTPAQIKAAILDTVDPLPSLDGKVKTGGRLNVGDAVTQSLLPPSQLSPKAPSDLSVIQQTNGTFTFKWKDNSKNETSFELQQSTDGGSNWTILKTLGVSVTTTTVSLNQVGNYEFRICAKNQYGNSDWSNVVHVYQTTPATPQTPTNLSVWNDDYNLRITWDSDLGATNYRLERSKTSGGTWTEVYSGTATEFIDSDVDSNQTYYYRVYAINDYVISSPSAQKSGTAQTRPIEDKAEITVSSIGAANVQLIWSDIKYANLYRIERFDSQKNKWVQIGETNVATFTDNSLKASTSYKYRIIAYNGFSTTSDEINITTLPPLPASPTSVKAVAQGSTTVELTWKIVADLNYRIEHSLTNKTDSWETVTITSEGKITGLTSGVKHYFRVYAINSSGESTKSSSVASVTLPPTAPEEPKNLAITNITDKTATLTWDIVANATNYKIEKYYNGKWLSAGTTKAGVTEYTVKSLKALTDYKFRIIALNKTVKSETSNEIAVTTPYAMTTTIAKSGYALTNGSDFAFMFSGKTPLGNNKELSTNETFQYELIVSASTKTDKNSGELQESISLGTISITLSADGKTYTSEPILFSKLGSIPNVNLTTLKTIQFQLKVTCSTPSASTSQQASAFYTKVAKLTLPKWFA